MNDMKIIDLVMLLPGKNERETFEGLLSSRQRSLEMRNVIYEILVHPRRDPGCFHEGPDILQPYQGIAQYSLVVLDYEGSGQEGRPPDARARPVRNNTIAADDVRAADDGRSRDDPRPDTDIRPAPSATCTAEDLDMLSSLPSLFRPSSPSGAA